MPTLQTELPPLPEGIYPATLAKIEERSGDRGAFLQWTFHVQFDGQERLVFAASSKKFGLNSKARQWARALGREYGPGESVDTDQFVGIHCRVQLIQFTLDDKRVVNRIPEDGVLPPALSN